jgi:tRNA1Val (adenine37-N6)-methyltransferase
MKKTGPDLSALRKNGETIDEISGSRLRIFQKEKGYRFSIDALLLAYFVHLKKGDHIIDLGTGSGVIAVIMAQRKECGRVVGVDIQEELVDMAKRSVQLNNLEEKVAICRGDVRNIEALFDSKSFNVAVFNPPYRKLKSGRVNPNDQKSIARHEVKATLRDFLNAAAYILKRSGHAYIIYPATRVVELLSLMRISGIEPKRMRIVHSHDASRAEFVLVEGIKSGHEGLEVMQPLFIYSEGSKYTEEMACIFREISGSSKASAE